MWKANSMKRLTQFYKAVRCGRTIKCYHYTLLWWRLKSKKILLLHIIIVIILSVGILQTEGVCLTAKQALFQLSVRYWVWEGTQSFRETAGLQWSVQRQRLAWLRATQCSNVPREGMINNLTSLFICELTQDSWIVWPPESKWTRLVRRASKAASSNE